MPWKFYQNSLCMKSREVTSKQADVARHLEEGRDCKTEQADPTVSHGTPQQWLWAGLKNTTVTKHLKSWCSTSKVSFGAFILKRHLSCLKERWERMAQHKLMQSPCQKWFLHSDGYCDVKTKLNVLIAIHFLGKYVKAEKRKLVCVASSSINISLT